MLRWQHDLQQGPLQAALERVLPEVLLAGQTQSLLAACCCTLRLVSPAALPLLCCAAAVAHAVHAAAGLPPVLLLLSLLLTSATQVVLQALAVVHVVRQLLRHQQLGQQPPEKLAAPQHQVGCHSQQGASWWES